MATDLYAERAVRAYQAMQGRFRKRDGSYKYDEGPALPGKTAQLWPFARALVATLDIAGIEPGLTGALDVSGTIAEDLDVLERYWDPAGPRPAYCSDVSGASRRGDRYYDDNAWVGLALIELERLRPGSGRVDRARDLFEFAASGWSPAGGVFWVEQGRGTGMRNHDRGTISNAPNAAVGLHLEDLGKPPDTVPGAEDMYRWVLDTLDRSRTGETPGTGLFWDKVRADGTIDRAIWTYNQGSMIGAAVLLARLRPDQRSMHLERAEAIARKALREFSGAYRQQPAAFNAIFFRNLLLLHSATQDEQLRTHILGAMAGYADRVWSENRDGKDLFDLGGKSMLLDQSAIVQVLALLAWDPASYDRVA